MDLDEPKLTVEFEDDSKSYHTEIKSYELDSDYLTPTDAWSFVVYDPDDPAWLRRTFRPWRPLKLFIEESLQVVGRIDRIESDGPSSLRVSGRDYVADICDGGVDPALKFKKEQDIGDAILSIVKPFGVTTLYSPNLALTRNILSGRRVVWDKAPPRDFKAAKLDEFKAQENEGAFECANKIAARHGFTIQPTIRRDWLVIGEPEYRQPVTYKLSRPGNIMHAKCSRDWSHVPTVTIARGRHGSPKRGHTISGTDSVLPTFTGGAAPELSNLVEVGRIIDPGILAIREKRYDPKTGDPQTYAYDVPVYRPMFYSDKDSRNVEQVERGVRRMIAERLRPTLVYEATIRGHRDPDSDAIFAVDTIAEVVDGIEDVNEHLWIQARKFSNDGSGPTTTIRMIRPGSFVL